MWPYLNPFSKVGTDNKTRHTTRILQKSHEIAVDPVLRSKLYCVIFSYPLNGERSLGCKPGNSSYWVNKWKITPIGMLRDNIPLSVFNATLAFLSLVFGILGK